jgi:glycosyltransferase involved in cell wall biosynthesis
VAAHSALWPEENSGSAVTAYSTNGPWKCQVAVNDFWYNAAGSPGAARTDENGRPLRLEQSDQDADLISVVVPVFNEEAVLPAFHQRASAMLAGLSGYRGEIVYVDDGSSDDSYRILSELAAEQSQVRVIKFSRNFGHQIAITAGMDHAAGAAVVVIDSDLQDPPEVIPEMVARWREGFDVVYGVRKARDGETAGKLVTAALFYRLLGAIARISIPPDAGDFRLMSRRVVDQLGQLREKDRFVRGLVSWVGFRQVGLSYHRDARQAGETKYPYRKMISFALDGIASFSTVPLRLATWLGYATSALAFLYLASVFVQKLLGFTVQGWATIMVALLLLGGVQLICLGIMGEYIGRIFTEIKPRPMYVVEETLGNDPPSAA